MITISKKEMKHIVTGMGKVMIKNTGSLPILTSLRFKSQKGKLVITGTNLDETLHYSIDNEEITSEEFLFPFKVFRSLSKGHGHVCFIQDKKNILRIQTTDCGGNTRQHAILSKDEFPSDLEGKIATKKDLRFLESYQFCAPYASTDEVKRTSLVGVFVDTDCMVATDGKRLTRKMYSPPETLSEKSILPYSTFLMWLKERSTRVGSNSSWFKLSTTHWTYLLRLREGLYPNYKQVIPELTKSNYIEIGDADRICDFIEQFDADDRNGITINAKELTHVDNDGLKSTMLFNTLPDILPTLYKIEHPTTVNDAFFAEALRSGFRRFCWEDDMCPVRSDNEDSTSTHVLMSMRIIRD